MKGRKPTPIEMHILNGNPGRRPLPEPIPVPQGRPECPEHFDEAAKVEWDFACEMIEHMGVLSQADRCAVEMFVDTYVRYRRACVNLDKYGEVLVVDKEKKIFQRSPYWSIRNATWEQLYKMLGEFGFTPVARARLKNGGGQKPDDDDPLAAMMKARAGRN